MIIIKRQTSFSANLLVFCRYLRQHQFTIGPAEIKDALLAVELVAPWSEATHLETCLQAVLCKSPKQLQKFSKLYKRYWQELDRAVDSKLKEAEEPSEKSTSENNRHQQTSLQAIKSWLYGNKNEETTETASYSAQEVNGGRGFPEFDERELQEVFKLVQQLVAKIANRRSRRFSKSHRKATLDMKQTIRRNLFKGEELLYLNYKAKKKNQIKVVLICDVSRSMELYSRFLLQFMFAFQKLFNRIDAFVFSTRLYHISEELNAENMDSALSAIMEKVHSWSGGTQIGSSLEAFCKNYGHKILTNKTLTIILSDGWDNGDPELVVTHMKYIKNRSLKVLWLNPLAGNTNWKPDVQAMRAALPYLDGLLPFHNLKDLQEVVKRI